jgi:ketosteroid isomerase-like protein
MANQADVEVVRNAYEAFSKGDMASLDQLFSDDIVFYVPGNFPLSGEYRSKKTVFEYFGQVAEQTGGTFRAEVRDIVASELGVVVLVTQHAEHNGKTVAIADQVLTQVQDGKVTEWRGYLSDPNAWDEFWL